MRMIVAGTREFADLVLFKASINKVLVQLRQDGLWDKKEDITIVSGMAKGADQFGIDYANQHNLTLAEFPAKWEDFSTPDCLVKVNKFGNTYNARAGNIRNQGMAEFAKLDNGVLLAFWDGKSKGTEDMIRKAKKIGLKVFIIYY